MKLTEEEFLSETLSPTERENRWAVKRQKIAYQKYLDQVDLYSGLKLEKPNDQKS